MAGLKGLTKSRARAKTWSSSPGPLRLCSPWGSTVSRAPKRVANRRAAAVGATSSRPPWTMASRALPWR